MLSCKKQIIHITSDCEKVFNCTIVQTVSVSCNFYDRLNTGDQDDDQRYQFAHIVYYFNVLFFWYFGQKEQILKKLLQI